MGLVAQEGLYFFSANKTIWIWIWTSHLYRLQLQRREAKWRADRTALGQTSADRTALFCILSSTTSSHAAHDTQT